MNVKGWHSIRQRLVLAFAIVTLLAGALQLWIAGRQIERATLDFFQRDLENDVYLARDRLALSGEGGDDDDSENATTQRLALAELQQSIGHDYAILNIDGSLEAASLALYGDFRQRGISPEVNQAYAQGHGSHMRIGSDGQERLYVAVPFYHDERASGALVLSQALQPIYADIQQRWLSLALATLPVLALALGMAAWFGTRIAQPIKALHHQALQVADGDLTVRVQLGQSDEIGALGSAFNHMADQLDQLLKTQRAFISNAAHELRTPLMTMQLRLEALQNSALDEAQRVSYLQEARQDLRHMAQLVTSLLVLARLDERRHTSDNSVYDIAALLADLGREWRRQAQQADIQLHQQLEHETDLPDVQLPAQDLRMVLNNLLSNALKYTPAGGNIYFSAHVQGKTLCFSVVDDGIGFAPEQATLIFTRFYRTEEARGRGIEGNGLGLSIAQAIVQQAGGQLTAESAGLGLGARFVLCLPCQPLKDG